MVCNINYNPWHSPNSHRPLLHIIRDSVGARRSPASALLRRPIGDVPPLEQPGLSDFTDVKQPKYRVLWELNGSSMGVQWEIEGRFMVFNGTFHPLQWSYETNHLSILWGEHEDMMEYHGSHEWYVQQHLRMSFFSGGVFHCPSQQQIWPSLFNLFTPRWKIWILHPAINPVNPKGPNSGSSQKDDVMGSPWKNRVWKVWKVWKIPTFRWTLPDFGLPCLFSGG